MIRKFNLINELEFCKELIDRLIKYADENYSDAHSYASNHTPIQNDIKRIRRELNEISKKLNWNYEED